MTIQVQSQGDTGIITLPELFTYEHRQAFQQACFDLLMADAKEMLLDFELVKTMDFLSLGILLAARKEASRRGMAIRIRNCKGDAARVMRVVNFDKLFEMK